jgi:20S proteasome alpha/beta subunit
MLKDQPPYQPYNWIRHLPIRGKPRLTTVVTFRYKDGILMATDRQGTTPDERSEPLSKLARIGDRILLGCAGASPYIADFRERLAGSSENKGDRSYKEILRSVITSYTSRVIMDAQQAGIDYRGYLMPRDSIIHGIMSAYDELDGSFHIFEFVTPHPPEDVSDASHAVIGSGAASASMILRGMDFLMNYSDKNPVKWTDFGIATAHLLGHFIVSTVAYVDIYTGIGSEVSVLTKDGSSAQPYTKFVLQGRHALDMVMPYLKEDIGGAKLKELLTLLGLS